MKKKLLFVAFAACGYGASASEPTDSVSLENVTVTGVRSATDVRQLPFTVTTISKDVLNENHRQNLLPTLTEQVPGLMVTSRGILGYGVSTGAAGGMTMRGLSSGAGQMMVLIDGHPQYNGVYGHSIADSYYSMMAERVEVLRGPASVLYGSNAMGGVINIVTDDLSSLRDGVQTTIGVGAGSYGTIQTEAMNRLRKGKFFSSVGGQYSRTDNHRPNMGFEQYGGFLKLGYDFSEHWRLTGDGSVTHFNASNPGSVTEPKLSNDQWITRMTANVVLENNFDRVKGAISIYDNFGIHKIDDGYNANGGTPQTDLFRSKDALAGVSWYETIRAWEGASWTLGVDYQHIYGRAWYTDKQTGEKVVTKKRLMQSCHVHDNEIAGYVQFHQNLGERWNLDAGLRLDNHSQAGTQWIPQGGIVYRPIENGQVKALVSKGFRNPTTREMYLYGTANSDSLKAENMMNYEISWHHSLKDVTYGLTAFFIDGKNMIQIVAGKNVNTGGFINKGVEADASWNITPHVTVMTNHSYVYMHNPIVGAPRYKGYLGTRMHYGKWGIVAGLQQLSHICTDVNAKSGNSYDKATLLNITVDYELMKNITLWAKGDNLFACKYETYKGYAMPRATFMAGVKVKL